MQNASENSITLVQAERFKSSGCIIGSTLIKGLGLCACLCAHALVQGLCDRDCEPLSCFWSGGLVSSAPGGLDKEQRSQRQSALSVPLPLQNR